MNEADKLINSVDWSNHATLYGRADGAPNKDGQSFCVPERLRALFSEDTQNAVTAAEELWNSFHSKSRHIMSAALPSYDILMHCLRTIENERICCELLDILAGFAECAAENVSGDKLSDTLHEKLLCDIEYFRDLTKNTNAKISECAAEICSLLYEEE
ncbi:MAG: hypothetical protein IJD85_09075 [Oscillospiraceae bacterium]|nr:hypothetical protein [Oscillospiraceae bacterium]